MPRRRRIVIPGQPHHITQRGNRRQNVFETDQDFVNYCYWMNKYSKMYQVDILAYCLMNNHVHLILIPYLKDSMARLFNTVHMRYTQYFNYVRKTSGHLWQGRYFSCVLDKNHLFKAIRYVEQNPSRAKMVKEPWDYKWSSARWHVGLRSERYIRLANTSIVDRKYWKDYLKSKDDETDHAIKVLTQQGLALAEPCFIKQWERQYNIVLTEKKAGRPRKQLK